VLASMDSKWQSARSSRSVYSGASGALFDNRSVPSLRRAHKVSTSTRAAPSVLASGSVSRGAGFDRLSAGRTNGGESARESSFSYDDGDYSDTGDDYSEAYASPSTLGGRSMERQFRQRIDDLSSDLKESQSKAKHAAWRSLTVRDLCAWISFVSRAALRLVRAGY
jgi:hypothetical protein